jgi:hypothetical protein
MLIFRQIKESGRIGSKNQDFSVVLDFTSFANMYSYGNANA